jgi:hypothetical protein
MAYEMKDGMRNKRELRAQWLHEEQGKMYHGAGDTNESPI